jgi:hypothetical protein
MHGFAEGTEVFAGTGLLCSFERCRSGRLITDLSVCVRPDTGQSRNDAGMQAAKLFEDTLHRSMLRCRHGEDLLGRPPVGIPLLGQNTEQLRQQRRISR